MNFNNILITWYLTNKRALPWRNTNNPYFIWVSEIIMQQTRVNQGLPYYHRFIEAFPTPETLANAHEQRLLKLWQGLGYYSRARNMHKAAKQIMELHAGVFPKSYNDIIALPGVGEYSAAAIASFAYNMPYAVTDGNVFRFISRYTGVETPVDTASGKKQIKEFVQKMIPEDNAANFNQAIMEFGATLCTKSKPACKNCPFLTNCYAYANNKTELLPIKSRKTKVKNRYLYYMVAKNEPIYIKRRTDKDIWLGLYDFPVVDSSKKQSVDEVIALFSEKYLLQNQHITVHHISQSNTHKLSHQTIFAVFIEAEFILDTAKHKEYKTINASELNSYPVPKLIENYLNSRG